MTEATREKLIAAMEQAMIDAGAQDWNSGMAQMSRILETLTTKTKQIDSKDKLREVMDSAPSLSRWEERILLYSFENLWPLMRKLAQHVAKKAIDTLPPLKGGRPPAFHSQTSGEILDYVSKLHRSGYSMELAKERAAIRFDCSQRTVERLWKNRGNPPEKPVTPEDVVAFLASDEST